MKKNRRAAYLLILVILCVPVLIFAVMGFYLSDENISGFTGIMGVMKLRGEESFVELTEQPLQLLIHRTDAGGTFENYWFDKWDCEDGVYMRGAGIKDGRSYTYNMRAFMREFYIVLLRETQ